MRVIVGTVDGHVHKSDEVSLEEIEQHIKENNGQIGTGIWADKRWSLDEWLDEMVGMALGIESDGMKPNRFSMEVNGVTRHIAPKHIVWIEIDRT